MQHPSAVVGRSLLRSGFARSQKHVHLLQYASALDAHFPLRVIGHRTRRSRRLNGDIFHREPLFLAAIDRYAVCVREGKRRTPMVATVSVPMPGVVADGGLHDIGLNGDSQEANAVER